MHLKSRLVRTLLCLSLGLALVLPALAAEKAGKGATAGKDKGKTKGKTKTKKGETPSTEGGTEGTAGTGGGESQYNMIMTNLRLWFKTHDQGSKGYLDRDDLAKAFNYSQTYDDGRAVPAKKSANKENKDTDKKDDAKKDDEKKDDAKSDKKDDVKKDDKKDDAKSDKKDAKKDDKKDDADKDGEDEEIKKLKDQVKGLKDELTKKNQDMGSSTAYKNRRDYKMMAALDTNDDQMISQQEFDKWAGDYAKQLAKYYDGMAAAKSDPGAGGTAGTGGSGKGTGPGGPGVIGGFPRPPAAMPGYNNRGFENSLAKAIGSMSKMNNQNLGSTKGQKGQKGTSTKGGSAKGGGKGGK